MTYFKDTIHHINSYLTYVHTCNMTLLINAFTDGVKIWLVVWKHHSTIPPLLNIVNKSNMITIYYKLLCLSHNTRTRRSQTSLKTDV